VIASGNELQGKKDLGQKITIVLSHVLARDPFAFGVFSPVSQEMPDGAGAVDQPEFAKLPPKKGPRPYTKLCKLAGRKTHILGNATFTATGEFANHLRCFANSRRQRAAARSSYF